VGGIGDHQGAVLHEHFAAYPFTDLGPHQAQFPVGDSQGGALGDEFLFGLVEQHDHAFLRLHDHTNLGNQFLERFLYFRRGLNRGAHFLHGTISGEFLFQFFLVLLQLVGICPQAFEFVDGDPVLALRRAGVGGRVAGGDRFRVHQRSGLLEQLAIRVAFLV